MGSTPLSHPAQRSPRRGSQLQVEEPEQGPFKRKLQGEGLHELGLSKDFSDKTPYTRDP